MVKAIVGANWGDEGKGKITDLLAEGADAVVRFQGGANAGHTIINEYGRFALHLLPSGIFNPGALNVIGPGVAFNPDAFLAELKTVREKGAPECRLAVSDRAQLLMPYHTLFDAYEEERLAGRSFGSTKSGIAPFYADKYSKVGFQLCELYGDEGALRDKLARLCEVKNVLLRHLYKKPELDPAGLFEKLLLWREALRPFVGDTLSALRGILAKGGDILLEGQLGSLRDPDYGIYPCTTSSSPLAGYACVGAGLPPFSITDIVCVTKAYSSAVGAGAFVSEIHDKAVADELRRRGGDAGEFGATTGRPRRMGWFDAVATRYGCMVQGATELVLTNLDVLGYLDEIPFCAAYRHNGAPMADFPTTPVLERCEPELIYLPGWKSDIRGCSNWEELPENARKYVRAVEEAAGVRVSMVSTGPRREEIIRL